MKLINQMENSDHSSPQETILQMAMSFSISQSIFAATKLGIADLLKDGPKHCDDLATATDTHSESLCRLLRALASIGIFSEIQPKCFQLTPLANCLQDNVPNSVRNFILLRAEQDYACWGNLIYSLRTGKSAFEHTYGMTRYQYNKQNPALAELFDRGMKELSVMSDVAVVAAYDFSSVEKLVDVGGGQGSLLATILRQYPIQGVLFDQSNTIENTRHLLEEKESIMERCELVSGDFFESVPAGADAYLLRNILHNWDDQRAIKILQNCYQAMAGEGRLLVIETVISENPNWRKWFKDLTMLVMQSSGRERTTEELHKLFEMAGFQLTKIIPTTSALSVIEGYALPES
jgi:ubiquinone/menaquinone biosynthesis C-methylase UbiE